MYILIEHSGTGEMLDKVLEIKDYLENDLGYTVEQVTGENSPFIYFYNDEGKIILRLDEVPTNKELFSYYFNDLEEDKE